MQSSIPPVHQAAMISGSRDMLLVCDLDGWLVAANDSLTRILGWSPEEMKRRGLSGSVHPDDLDATLAALGSVRDEPLAPFTNRQRRVDGSWAWIEWTGQKSGEFMYFVGRDVSDRVSRERAGSAMHVHYVEAQLLGGVGHWRRDLRTGEVLWSEGVFAAFGLDPKAFETEYAQILDHIHPEDSIIVDTALARIAETGQGESFEFRVPHADGERIVWAEGRREMGPDGPEAVFGVVRDVTEERRRVRALEQARREALEVMEVARAASEEKSRFLASMSHELRTPLNAIIGFSEMMTLGTFGPLPDRYDEYSNHILGSARFLLTLINDMLDLSRVEAGQRALDMRQVDPAPVVRACLAQVEVSAKDKGLTLNVEAAEGRFALFVDERALRQMLLNLLSNAIKFTSAGGVVSVTVSQTDQGAVALAVSDTGLGVAPEDQPRLFKAFNRAPQADALAIQGTGLGLALVKALADLHGASVRLESTPGEGTTVTLTFPPPATDRTPRTAAALATTPAL
jgi:PAS domain S-box-containing protein